MLLDLLGSTGDLDASNSLTYSLELAFPSSLFATSSKFREDAIGFDLELDFDGMEKESFMVEPALTVNLRRKTMQSVLAKYRCKNSKAGKLDD